MPGQLRHVLYTDIYMTKLWTVYEEFKLFICAVIDYTDVYMTKLWTVYENIYIDVYLTKLWTVYEISIPMST